MQTSAGGNGERPLVLVVEDNEHDWEIYGKMLWYNGFDVVAAKDAESALAHAHSRPPDIVLVDLELPGMSGLEFCAQLRDDPVLNDVPVVMLTAHDVRRYGQAAEKAGCATYLEKPISPVNVLHAVEELVGRPPPEGEERPPEMIGSGPGGYRS
jgi:CheY-like chemotaxis protein